MGILDVIAAMCFVAMLACVLVLIRNERVLAFRRSPNACIFRAGGERWRYDAKDVVPYEAMVFKFWKPLRADAWYADRRFLGEGQ